MAAIIIAKQKNGGKHTGIKQEIGLNKKRENLSASARYTHSFFDMRISETRANNSRHLNRIVL